MSQNSDIIPQRCFIPRQRTLLLVLDREETVAGINRFACIAIAVKDQDEALECQKRVDRPALENRFLTVSASNQPDLQVILASWFPGHSGKNPTAILHTNDCQASYDELRDRRVVFTEGPQGKPFGLRPVFKDLYGNSYALLQPGASHA